MEGDRGDPMPHRRYSKVMAPSSFSPVLAFQGREFEDELPPSWDPVDNPEDSYTQPITRANPDISLGGRTTLPRQSQGHKAVLWMNSTRVTWIRKRKKEDDDMMLFILPALHLMCSTRVQVHKKPWHISRLSGKERLREILEGHVMDCRVAFRMEPNIFKSIADYLRRKKLIVDTRGVKVEESLGFFLYMLSHNASFETFHRHIKNPSRCLVANFPLSLCFLLCCAFPSCWS